MSIAFVLCVLIMAFVFIYVIRAAWKVIKVSMGNISWPRDGIYSQIDSMRRYNKNRMVDSLILGALQKFYGEDGTLDEYLDKLSVEKGLELLYRRKAFLNDRIAFEQNIISDVNGLICGIIASILVILFDDYCEAADFATVIVVVFALILAVLAIFVYLMSRYYHKGKKLKDITLLEEYELELLTRKVDQRINSIEIDEKLYWLRVWNRYLSSHYSKGKKNRDKKEVLDELERMDFGLEDVKGVEFVDGEFDGKKIKMPNVTADRAREINAATNVMRMLELTEHINCTKGFVD